MSLICGDTATTRGTVKSRCLLHDSWNNTKRLGVTHQNTWDTQNNLAYILCGQNHNSLKCKLYKSKWERKEQTELSGKATDSRRQKGEKRSSFLSLMNAYLGQQPTHAAPRNQLHKYKVTFLFSKYWFNNLSNCKTLSSRRDSVMQASFTTRYG